MPDFIDQMGRTVTLRESPRRIVSLVPSQTELLHALGLRDEVVGITKFCIHPSEWFHEKARVGGTKNLNFERIQALAPDLILGNKEENEQAQMEALFDSYPIWMSDITTLDDSLQMIMQVGELVGRAEEALTLAREVRDGFNQFAPTIRPRSCAYLIWRSPWMVAGHSTFIDHLLVRCGLQNVFTNEESRYPKVSDEQLASAQPEVILLSSEPYPFKEKHIAELSALCPKSQILLIDGEMCSWYGSRLLETPRYLSHFLKALRA